MNALVASQRGTNLLRAVALIITLLLVSWLLTAPVQAEVGLTVEVVRDNNLLVATAKTVSGSEVAEDSWRWVKADECNLSLFSGDVSLDTGWTVILSGAEAAGNYCFYVEDNQDRKSVGSISIGHPMILIQQNNDQLIAVIDDSRGMNSNVDEESWQWYRYHAIEGSVFGCAAEFGGLDQTDLRNITSDDLTVDVYETQKNVYGMGYGSTTNLTENDEGMNYCFMVYDTAGIAGTMHITVGDVIVDRSVGKVGDSESNGAVNSGQSETGVDGSGEITSGDDLTAGSDSADVSDNGNLIRNLGLVLLSAAVIVGVVMLIRRSQAKDDEDEASA